MIPWIVSHGQFRVSLLSIVGIKEIELRLCIRQCLRNDGGEGYDRDRRLEVYDDPAFYQPIAAYMMDSLVASDDRASSKRLPFLC